MKAFASDNYSGVHPEVMEALNRANHEHERSYGADDITQRTINIFKNYFGNDIEVFFVYNGTGANVLGLQALTQSFHSIICSALAHITVDESTAPEKFTGCKLIGIPTSDGKIYPDQVEQKIQRLGDQHHPQAKVISISQSTEYSTVYSVEEVKALAAVAKKFNLYLHMDGARISNAAVSLGKDFRAFTTDAGVDVLSFGGAKNGMIFGEAVVFFNREMAKYFPYIRKQGMQLHSKMRFISSQFEALLSNDLWRRNATHANTMAKKLEEGLSRIPQIKITQNVDGNGVFAIMPESIIEGLQKEFHFYVWNERTNECRLMCSFDTKEEEIERLVEKAKALCSAL
ncbi:MAG: low specificity L-threonine aldolase [Cyclobacteriaceae bacterium]|nr:low specificity L-threonine aldolase [Cyclobacteriaceae bacterium]UYN87876.1 MAG: low specificity L-threonine aldolase [Cyclobacteriaceae bacterium]